MAVWKHTCKTMQGMDLDLKLLRGSVPLVLTKARTGSGSVSPVKLIMLKDVESPVQELPIQAAVECLDEDTVRIPVILKNTQLEESYNMRQLGVYAEDPDIGEILYIVLQSEEDENVPSNAEVKDFTLEWYLNISVGNAENVEVVIDETCNLTIDQGDARYVKKSEGKGLSSNDYTNDEKEKLKNIDKNANNYTHPTTAGNKHIPSGGSAGQVLTYGGSSGTAFWGNSSYYGTCQTAAATAAKTVSLPGFSLFTGATVAVMFLNGNTAADPTLNVNGTGAKAIYYRNAALTASTAGIISKNGVYLFVYSGSCWQLTEDTGFNNNCTTLWSSIICNESESSVNFYVPKKYWHNDNLTLMIDCVKYQQGTGVISPPHSKTVMATVTRKREIYVVVDNVPVLNTYSAAYDNGKVNKFNIRENFSMSGETTMDIMVDAEPLTTTDYAEVTVRKLDSSPYVITDIYAVMPQEQEG